VGKLQVGYARFIAPPRVDGTAVFSGIDTGSGTVLFEAGVPSASALQEFSLFLDSLGEMNTGLALVAPNSQNGATQTEGSNVRITLFDTQHSEIGSTEITLNPGQKRAKFIYEFFDNDALAATVAKEMLGMVEVVSLDQPLAAVTLRQLVAKEGFPLLVPTLTTFPVVPGVSGPGPGWKLVWADEFEGTEIDSAKWGYQTGGNGWGNNELQYYTDRSENSFIEDGKLVIQVRREDFSSRDYTSARMRTKGKGDWKYGRFEIRARLPEGQGIWPALWMMPTDDVYGGWAASGEIDIMEHLGHEPDLVYGNLHFGGPWPNNLSSGAQTYRLPSGKFSDDFHVFALEWEEGEFRWYVDGIKFMTINDWKQCESTCNPGDPGAPFPAPFDERFHFIFNIAVGGDWPGRPDETTVFPQRMEVDYARVYQKTD
jgi:beta-glucanase (GH16 family)